jgi:hypothetical protein
MIAERKFCGAELLSAEARRHDRYRVLVHVS